MFKEILWKYDKDLKYFIKVKSFDSVANICNRLNEKSQLIGIKSTDEIVQLPKETKKHTIIINYNSQVFEFTQEILIIPGINFDFEMTMLMFFKNISTNQEFSDLVNYLRTLQKWRTTKKWLADDIIFEQDCTTLITSCIPSQILKIFRETFIRN